MPFFKKAPTPPHEAPIDREGRDRLADALEGFLNCRLNSCELDERIDAITSSSNDPTLRFAASEIGYYYDDLEPHTAILERDDWNHLYRLMLLLRSNGHVALEKRWKWSLAQIFAAPLFMTYLMLWWLAGSGALVISMPFGLILTPIAFWLLVRRLETPRKLAAMTPFSSISELLVARRSVPDFRKTPYQRPEDPESAQGVLNWCFWIFMLIVWAAFAGPFLLFFLALPYFRTKTRVVFRA